MSIPIPATMETTRVTWNLGWTQPDTTGTVTDLVGAQGKVRFEPEAVAVAYPDKTILPTPVETRVVDGVMRQVYLTRNDPDVWNWRVVPMVGVDWQPFHINVAGSGMNLAQAVLVPGKGPARVVKGTQGDQGASITAVNQTGPETVDLVITDPATGTTTPETIRLPRGLPGPGNTLSIGTVQRGENPAASITGPAPSQSLNLVLPRGEQGLPGVNAVPADQAVAGYVTATSQTRAALEAAYRRSVSVREYGAVGNGTTDDTAAVRSALTQNPGASIYFPPGTYRLTGPLAVPANTFLAGADSTSTVLDWSSMPAFQAGGLLEWAPGTLGASTPLAADAAFGDPSITLPSGHGFAAGDYLRITTEEVLFSEMTKAEFHRVLEVVGNVVHLSGPVFDTYTMALGGRVQKAELATGGVQGLSIIGKGINTAGYGDNAVRFALAHDVHVSDVRFDDVENKCIQLDSVLGANVNDCHFRFDPSRTPLQYGVAIQGASQLVSVRGCSSWNDRHMVTTATSQSLAEHSTALRGIPRVVTVTGCTAHGSWQCPIDTHRGGEYVTVTGCSLTTESTGIKFRGKHCIAVGNVIIGKRTSVGGAPYGVRIGMLCDGIQITGNMIRNFEDGVRIDTPDGATRALVISENSILDCERPVGIHGTTLIEKVRIAGNTLRALGSGYPLYIIAAVNDLDVTGNVAEGGQVGIFMAHPSRPVNRMTVQGNTFRGQAVRAAFFRNITDVLVTSNFAPGVEIRFSGPCVRTTTGLNMATISDLSDGKTVIQK